ncbi:DUF4102 domain-containing protein [Bartonella machadoae]|uniref:DUF4102 domain-containing protein n=1 Tax=Bartonella machadoae TaxID=2893471 RepID=UPI003562352B
MNHLNARAVATLEASKEYDEADLFLQKRTDDGNTLWLYRYTIHKRRREIGLVTLRDLSLSK